MLTTATWVGGYVLASVGLAAVAYVYWTNRTVRGLEYLLVAALLGSVQSLSSLMVLVAPALAAKVALQQLSVVLGAAVVALWYLFVVSWTRRRRLASGPALALVVTPLLVGCGLMLSNATPSSAGYHRLFWTGVDVATQSDVVARLAVEDGPAAVLFDGYRGLVLVGSVGLLASFARRADQRLYRWRNTLVALAGVVAVLLAIGLAMLDVAFEADPLVYVLAHTFVVVGVGRFGGYDVVSLPENSLIEAIEGGVLVYGSDGTVIDVNRTTRRILDGADDAVGMGIVAFVEVAESLPSLRTTDAAGAERAPGDPAAVAELLDGHEFTTDVNGASRSFLVRVSALRDDGERLGWTVLFYDVTELRQKQHELDLLKQVLSRILRHNVRNDLSVVKANANELAEEATGLEAERLRTIVEKSDDLLAASEKARTVEQLVAGERTRREFDLVDVVREAIDAVSAEFPGVAFETSLPGDCQVRAHWALPTAVENVVENAAMHNDAAEPQVGVSVDREDGRVILTVADNGPGIPYKELDVLDSREETQLDHGSRVGLWLIDWIVDLSRGEIDFENTDRGCTVSLDLEPADTGAADATGDVLAGLDFATGSPDDDG